MANSEYNYIWQIIYNTIIYGKLRYRILPPKMQKKNKDIEYLEIKKNCIKHLFS